MSGIHLESFTQGIMSNGGEGTILRKFNSTYSHGRTQDLIKFKVCSQIIIDKYLFYFILNYFII